MSFFNKLTRCIDLRSLLSKEIDQIAQCLVDPVES